MPPLEARRARGRRGLRLLATATLLWAAAPLPAVGQGADDGRLSVGAPIRTALDVGVVLAEPGGYPGRQPGAPVLGETTPAVRLRAETRHADIGFGWDASAAFDVGRTPLFTMMNAGSGAIPGYVNGWLTSAALQFARASRSSETLLYGRTGATRLSTEARLTAPADTHVSIAANDIGPWAYFVETGVHFRWFERDMAEVHAANRLLDPLVQMSVGLRHDQRLHRAGDLSELTDPTGRLFFGFAVMPVRVTDPRRPASGARIFTAGGAFDYEGALRGSNRAPSGYRLTALLSVDLTNLVASHR